ncbi:MAG: DNA gyrase subunit A [Chloroflexi bacterium]|nr:DNA gyrase subunit A [Chloroflexota bacterium]
MDRFDSQDLGENAGTIRTITINEEMRGSYLNYAMSVIVARALPDARDGLKPVHRRILFAMHDMGLRPGTAYKKSARLVGEVLGKYHPHGDQAVYDAMARMAQDFSLRYPLVDGQGNFGSQDGDKPAAMRYTEARMANIASEMLTDINMNTVDFAENYDGTQEEPTVLPARLPNLLLNGASGIAVGMATNIPPHNLRELADAIIHLIDSFERIDSVTVDDLMQYVKGPDFPTGAKIGVGNERLPELKEAYAKGKGRVTVRSTYSLEDGRGKAFAEKVAEEQPADVERIVFTSIPYQASKAGIIERIVSLVREGRIEGIRDLRDESDRQGLRLVVELKRDAQYKRVLNQLFSFTQLQTVHSIQMLALVNGEPRLLSLKRCLKLYIEHRYDVIVRRSEFDLERQRARAHVLMGLLKAVSNIDQVIQTIRNSADVSAARVQLMALLELDEVQANAILEMQLRRLAALERQKLQDEYDVVQSRIGYLEELLGSPRKILNLIRDDVTEIADKYGDERNTKTVLENFELDEENLYRRENVVISLTENSYIKRVAARHYRAQKRGGKGMRGMALKTDDKLMDIFFAYSHDMILFFSDRGRVYSCVAYEIPETQREKRGTLIQSVLPLEGEEKITAVVSLTEEQAEQQTGYFVLATSRGKVKRVAQREFADVRHSGLIAINLLEGDNLRWVKWSNGDQQIVMASANGQSILFHETEVRAMGRQAAGVMGMELRGNDEIAGMDVVPDDDAHVLVVTRNGYGKRTPVTDYRKQSRYGFGVRTLRRNDRTGPVIAVRCVKIEDEIMLISKNGIVLRTRLSEIREIGRNTQGVIVMKFDNGDEVAGVAIMQAENQNDLESHDGFSANGASIYSDN